MDSDPTLSDDLKELSIEKQINTQKSTEEIEKLTVDEKLNDIERSVYLLSSGQEVQRLSVINALPDLLKNNNAECMRRVVPKIREVLHVAQAEMQLAACSAFVQILQNQLVPLPNYTQTFLQTILKSLDCRDIDIANAWLDTLLDVIDLLPKDVIKKDIMTVAMAKGQISQPVQSRLSCCKILGKIATKFEPFVIKREVLPVVQSLCQDVDYEVRGCMCRQLDSVSRGLGLESTKSAILPELVELTNDEESFVRLAGLETVVNILSLLDDETCTATIIPLVCKFLQQACANKDSTLPTVAKQLGRLCHGLSVNLTDDQKHWFITYYKKLCKLGVADESRKDKADDSANKQLMPVYHPNDLEEEEEMPVECRKNAAYNFPAMVLFAGNKSFKTELHATFIILCGDPNPAIRKKMATGFHEVAKLLGTHVNQIFEQFTTLLGDDCIEVLKGIISSLPETIDIFSRGGGSNVSDSKLSLMAECVPGILQCDTVISASNNWRLQEELMTHFSSFHKCFHNEVVYHQFIPLVFRKLHMARPLPVRHAAAKTLLILLRKTKKLERRQDMCEKLIQEFCKSKSCYKRSLFIDICTLVADIFSRRFFKENFYEDILTLTSDPVPNIRLRVCPILPILKAQVVLPTDRNLLQLLEVCIRKLLVNEKDKDVCAAVQKAVEALDKVQPHMELLGNKRPTEADMIDREKEEEENLLLELEEKEKKEEQEAMKSAKGERHKLMKKESAPGVSRIPAPTGKKSTKPPAAAAGVSTVKKEGRSSSGQGSQGTINAGNGSKSKLHTPSNSRNLHGSAGLTKNRDSSASSSSSSRFARKSSIGNSPESSSKPGSLRYRRTSTGSLGTNVAASVSKKSHLPHLK